MDRNFKGSGSLLMIGIMLMPLLLFTDVDLLGFQILGNVIAQEGHLHDIK